MFNPTILIVDDSKIDRDTYRRYLQSLINCGYRILDCESGEEALDLCQRDRPQLILLDYLLDDMDGLEFLRQLADRIETVPPTIMLTGEGSEMVAVEAMKLGVKDYQVKRHLTSQNLVNIITNTLTQQQLQAQIDRQQQQQNLLASITIQIGTSIELPLILQAAVDGVRQLLDCDRAIVYKLSLDLSGTVVSESVLHQWVPILDLQIEKACFASENTDLIAKYLDGHKLVVSDIETADFKSCYVEMLRQFQVKALLAVPIIFRDISYNCKPKLWGLIIVHNCKAARIWQPEELDLIDQMSIQMAIAIQQAELVLDLKIALQDLQRKELNGNFLMEIQTDLATIKDETEIIDAVGEKIRNFFGLSVLAFSNIDLDNDSGQIFSANCDADILDTVATHRISDYLSNTHIEKIQTGAIVAIDDVTADPDIKDGGAAYLTYQVYSIINVPYLSNGEWKYLMSGSRCEPSNWRADEKELMSELTARIYLRIERTRAETLLQQSNQRFEGAMQAINGIVYEWHLGTDYVYRSPGLFKLIGIHATDALPTKEWWSERMHPEDRERLGEIFATMPPDCDRLQQEYRVLHADGRWIDVWDRSLLKRNSEGKIITMIGSTSDISDRKQIQQRLQESEQRLRAGIEVAGVGLARFDYTTNLVALSPEAAALYGFDPDTSFVTREQIHDTFHSDERAELEEIIAQVIDPAGTGWFARDHRVMYPNGEVRCLSVRKQVFFDRYGAVARPSYAILAAIDITDRKRDESALKQSEERYRNLVELIPQLVWKATPEGVLLDVNQRWLDFTGLTLAQVNCESWETVIYADDLLKLYQSWELAQQAGKYEAEGRMRRADGQYRWHLHQAIAEKNECGQITKWFGTATDIDDLKQLEQGYSDLLVKVQERNQELDQFTHIVSHDLKAPLRAISNLAQWLEDDLEDSILLENKQQLQLMRSRVLRMEGLINGLLSYARIGREQISTDLVSISDLLAEIIDSLDPPSTFRIEFPSALPTFCTKRILLNQVLSNLIGNAIKHHDRPDGKVSISVEESPEFYKFVVADDGKGIDPSQQKRIFDIFQTLDSDKSESTGIGLAIVKKIIETQGGSIWVESSLGQGSAFAFTWR